MSNQKYTTQLSAGLGLKEETKSLFNLYESGMTVPVMCGLALNSGLFPNITARRLRNIIAECFFPRYKRDNDVADVVKILTPILTSQELSQLFFLYTAKSNLILADFVTHVYWQKYESGYAVLNAEDAISFVELALQEGKMQKIWSDSTIKRVSSYILGCLVDYGFLVIENRKERLITPPRLSRKMIVYLAYELHFSGEGDNSVINHKDWQLFGLSPNDVQEEIKSLAVNKHWIIQAAGEVVQISWTYKNREEMLSVITQS
jgi:hypothetical protein